MSSSPLLRALWGAALCCALPLATRAAEPLCLEPWQSAPMLLAAASAAAAANPAAGSFQRHALRSGGTKPSWYVG